MSLFPMNLRGKRALLIESGVAIAVAAIVSGCGSTYRPVVTPINPTGPAAQPAGFAIVISSPSPTTAGIATVIDYSGDTIVALAPVGPGPLAFSLDENGTTGYTVNSDGTLTNFPATNQLQEKNVTYSTLPASALSVNLFSPSAGLWVADLNGNVADVLTGSPETFKLSIPVAATPIEIVGSPLLGQRNYAISLNNSTTSTLGYDTTCNIAPSTVAQTGEADSLEVASYTVSARIPLGVCPVYSIQSADNRRLFVLNRGSDTVTVINSQLNTLDNLCPPPTGCVNQNGQTYFSHPALPLSTTAVTATGITPPNGTTGMTAVAGPVYGEYIQATQQLVVSNYDGNTITVIDVSLDEYGNDSPTFGTTFTIPVGTNPSSVTALADGSRAYTSNQADGTVTIVNLTSHTVEKTLTVVGHPRTVVSTSNSLYGKVYVASPDSPYLTIIRTDQDIVDTTILVEGNIVDVRVTTQNGTAGNGNAMSRRPGAGQPCYLPGAAPEATLAACQTLP